MDAKKLINKVVCLHNKGETRKRHFFHPRPSAQSISRADLKTIILGGQKWEKVP